MTFENLNEIRVVNKILILVKYFSREGNPLILTQISKDWSFPILINMNLPKEELNDIEEIKLLLSSRLSINPSGIDVSFDRNDENHITREKKLTADPEKRKKFGEYAFYNLHYGRVKIKNPNPSMLRSAFTIGAEHYMWNSLGALKSMALARTHNADVLRYLSNTFDLTLYHLELGVDKNIIMVHKEDDVVDSFNGLNKSFRELMLESKAYNFEYDIFISHASEDKRPLVEPLAHALRSNGLRVWYDGFEIKLGDSISEKINDGLAKSRFGLVVLSPDYIKKDWTRAEFRAMINKSISFSKYILPIWHNVSRNDVLKFNEIVVDRMAISSSGLSIDQISSSIIDVVNM